MKMKVKIKKVWERVNITQFQFFLSNDSLFDRFLKDIHRMTVLFSTTFHLTYHKQLSIGNPIFTVLIIENIP